MIANRISPVMTTSGHSRHGITVTEVLVTLGIVAILCAIGIPWILSVRADSRKLSCSVKMGTCVQAMIAFHDQNGRLPAAANWDTSVFRSIALHESRRWDMFIKQNWAVELLPYLDQTKLANTFSKSASIGSDDNQHVRESLVAELVCPSDTFSRIDNHYVYEPAEGRSVSFARGNYAINGGTHSFYTTPGSTTTPTGDHAHLVMDAENRIFEYWGNGIAGFNKSFQLDEFQNGLSTLVAINELRAGIDTLDLRGSWALGHIAASVTWGHGVNGDAYAPNNNWARSDDIQDCGLLNEKLTPEKLIELGMPCVTYIDRNQNASSRSMHESGVNTGFLDGSVRFISDNIDPGVWHVLHARETPAAILAGEPDSLVRWTGAQEEALAVPSSTIVEQKQLANSIGMEFTLIPAGEFTMGVPDQGNDRDIPPETPAHRVRISKLFYLGITEVTQSQYDAVMGLNSLSEFDSESGQLPVTSVTWENATEFCQRLSELSEESGAGRTYRLPTEAEWEYACREGRSDAYAWNTASADRGATGEAAGISPPIDLGVVGSYPANAFGLHDMRGNAWEWTADWFDRDYYGRSSTVDPTGPKDGYLKVVRGSDWIYVGEACFINYPILPPWKASPVVGFRVVCIRSQSPRNPD